MALRKLEHSETDGEELEQWQLQLETALLGRISADRNRILVVEYHFIVNLYEKSNDRIS